MMRIAIAIALFSLVGCVRTIPQLGDVTRCATGDQRGCTCSTGASGKQVCLATTGGFDACDCIGGMSLSSPPQIVAGAPLSAIAATLTDSDGQPIAESLTAVAKLTVSGGPSMPTMGATVPVTAGRVSFPEATLTIVGHYSAHVEIDGLLMRLDGDVSFDVIAGAPAKLVVTTEPPGVFEHSSTIVPAPIVEVQDSYGNRTADSGRVITAALENVTGGPLVLGAFFSATSSAGAATFDKLSVSGGNGSAQIGFSASGLTSGTSRAITFTQPDVEWARFAMAAPSLSGVGSGVRDATTGLLWANAVIGPTSVTGANSACTGLPLVATDTLHSWRAPSLIETLTLLDTSVAPPFVPSGIFMSAPTGRVWTRSGDAASGEGWTVDFAIGQSALEAAGTPHVVLCVLATDTPAAPPADSTRSPLGQFSPVGDGAIAVVDNRTQLTWFRSDVMCAMCDAATAAATCAAQTALAPGAWRLPTAKELASIVNVRINGGAHVDPSFFPQTDALPYWSSTNDPLNMSNALVVDFGSGAMASVAKSTQSGVSLRCVR